MEMQEVVDSMFLPLPGLPPGSHHEDQMDVIVQCLLKGVFFYPGYYEDDRGRGDQLMIAPPFIITEEQIDECVAILMETLQDSRDKYYAD